MFDVAVEHFGHVAARFFCKSKGKYPTYGNFPVVNVLQTARREHLRQQFAILSGCHRQQKNAALHLRICVPSGETCGSQPLSHDNY
jgi:hypothetical protein